MSSAIHLPSLALAAAFTLISSITQAQESDQQMMTTCTRSWPGLAAPCM